MANNYLSFSVQLAVADGKADEVQTIVKQISDFCNLLSDASHAEELNTAPLHPVFDSELGKNFVEYIRSNEEYYWAVVEVDALLGTLYVYSEEYGNPELVADFIKLLLDYGLIVVEEYVLLEWAETCSKPRPGEFGGGACMISRKGIEWRESNDQWAKNLYHGQ